MATELEYAELANRVYNRTQRNRTPVPEGWDELRWLPDPAYSGFSAGVYQKGGEIVISFTGTNEGRAVDFLEAGLVLANSLAVKVVLDRLDLTLDVASNQTMSRRAANSVASASRSVA